MFPKLAATVFLPTVLLSAPVIGQELDCSRYSHFWSTHRGDCAADNYILKFADSLSDYAEVDRRDRKIKLAGPPVEYLVDQITANPGESLHPAAYGQLTAAYWGMNELGIPSIDLGLHLIQFPYPQSTIKCHPGDSYTIFTVSGESSPADTGTHYLINCGDFGGVFADGGLLWFTNQPGWTNIINPAGPFVGAYRYEEIGNNQAQYSIYINGERVKHVTVPARQMPGGVLRAGFYGGIFEWHGWIADIAYAASALSDEAIIEEMRALGCGIGEGFTTNNEGPWPAACGN